MSNVAHLPQEPLWMCLSLSFMQFFVCVCVSGDWSFSEVEKQNVYFILLFWCLQCCSSFLFCTLEAIPPSHVRISLALLHTYSSFSSFFFHSSIFFPLLVLLIPFMLFVSESTLSVLLSHTHLDLWYLRFCTDRLFISASSCPLSFHLSQFLSAKDLSLNW